MIPSARILFSFGCHRWRQGHAGEAPLFLAFSMLHQGRSQQRVGGPAPQQRPQSPEEMGLLLRWSVGLQSHLLCFLLPRAMEEEPFPLGALLRYWTKVVYNKVSSTLKGRRIFHYPGEKEKGPRPACPQTGSQVHSSRVNLGQKTHYWTITGTIPAECHGTYCWVSMQWTKPICQSPL